MQKLFLSIVASFLISIVAHAQKALPLFDLQKGPRKAVLITWKNNYGDDLIQVNIQRSTDSAKNYKTIFSPEDATIQANGYTDKNAPEGILYYRIFYMLKSGAYYFSAASSIQNTIAANVPSKKENEEASSIRKENPVVDNSYLQYSITKLGAPLIKIPSKYNSTLYSLDIMNPKYPQKILFHASRLMENVFTLDKGIFGFTGSYPYILREADTDKIVERGNILIQ